VEPDDYIDIQPWPAAELVGQLVAHVALGRRGLIELDSAADAIEQETDRFELEAWARTELSSWLEPAESEVLAMPAGELSPEQADVCADAILVASTIAWAIRIVNSDHLPLPVDNQAEQRTLDWAPGPWIPVRNVVKAARLRSDEELAQERERWEIIHWRTTLFEDPAMADDDRSALSDILGELAGNPALQATDHDLALDDGTAIGDLDASALEDLQRLSGIRLMALNWVCGFGESPTRAPLFVDE